jgi:hypothetical protein
MPRTMRMEAFQGDGFAFDLRLPDMSSPLEGLLASGGDQRLTLDKHDNRNSYGCTSFPRSFVLDFGSSTASTVSPKAFEQARESQAQLWLDAARTGVTVAFDEHCEGARDTLRVLLGIAGSEIVFSPSGTDAQLKALFLARTVLGAPLTTIVAGSDQTGSGTAFTARGQHFNTRTSQGVEVNKGEPISGLCQQVRSVNIPFCEPSGRLRSELEMDDAIFAAVADAAGRGEKILLQVMDSSKLGWRAPSAACMHHIAATWPDQVCIVVDACQMRIGRPQLQDYLARGYFVLITGSKFFTGPAFSGALLVPASKAEKVRGASAPLGLLSYSSCYDWPRLWQGLRNAFPTTCNNGQWLRWEAAMAEMTAYFAVPATVREAFLASFAAKTKEYIRASHHLELVETPDTAKYPDLCEEMRHQTIFSFVPFCDGKPLSLEHCAELYRAMGLDLSRLLPPSAPDDIRRTASRVCQVGQPVALAHDRAALRICASARLVSSSWATADSLPDALLPVLADVRTVIEKLDWLIANPQFCEGQ